MLVLGVALFVLGLTGLLYKPDTLPGQWLISFPVMTAGVYIISLTEQGPEIIGYGLLAISLVVLVYVISVRRSHRSAGGT